MPGWHLTHIGPNVRRGPHTDTDGLFGSKASARTFERTGRAVPAEVGTCFKAVWPARDREATTSEVHDLDPLLVPEPHVRHRSGWDSMIGWVQGTRWLGVTDDGDGLRLQIAEAWVRAHRTRVDAISSQDVVFGRIDSPLPGWALFGALQAERLHVIVVPQGADGAPVIARPTSEASAEAQGRSRSLGCIWRRFAVTPQPATYELYLDARAETRQPIEVALVEYEGTPGLVVRSPA